jgi:hypothetical protein
VLASLCLKGSNDSIPMSQITLIGIAATGPTIKDKIHLLQDNYNIKKNEDEWSLKNKLKDIGFDINQSCLALIGDEDCEYGHEVPFRGELERYISEKFAIPNLQFVFGGGRNTIATILGFQSAPNALSCIVKGSGRFCHAIERCKELQFSLNFNDEEQKKRTGMTLQTAGFKKKVSALSNHDFGQLQSIILNQSKSAPPILYNRRVSQFLLIVLPRFMIFDYKTKDPKIILKKLEEQQALHRACDKQSPIEFFSYCVFFHAPKFFFTTHVCGRLKTSSNPANFAHQMNLLRFPATRYS